MLFQDIVIMYTLTSERRCWVQSSNLAFGMLLLRTENRMIQGVSKVRASNFIQECIHCLLAHAFGLSVSLLLEYRGVRQLQVHHEVTEWTVYVSAVALHRRVIWRVHQVDGDVPGRIGDVVRGVQGLDLLVAGTDDCAGTNVGAGGVQAAYGQLLKGSLVAGVGTGMVAPTPATCAFLRLPFGRRGEPSMVVTIATRVVLSQSIRRRRRRRGCDGCSRRRSPVLCCWRVEPRRRRRAALG